MSVVKNIFKISLGDWLLFFEALIKLYGCRIRLLFSSFDAMQKRYTTTNKSVDFDQNTPRSIRRAIRRANKLTFWKNKCLVSTFCAKRMLNKRKIPSKAYLGVRKSTDGEVFAHAWILVDDISIIPKEYDYTELHEF